MKARSLFRLALPRPARGTFRASPQGIRFLHHHQPSRSGRRRDRGGGIELLPTARSPSAPAAARSGSSRTPASTRKNGQMDPLRRIPPRASRTRLARRLALRRAAPRSHEAPRRGRDGRADIFETVSDGWGIKGDYHEYTFGSQFDKEGNLWCALCLTGSFTAEALYRGWILRVSHDGKLIPTASGVRSPGGIASMPRATSFIPTTRGPGMDRVR